jgi:outer membrane protein TolC
MLINLQNNEVSIKEIEYALINARKTEESGLWSEYYGLLNQEDQIEVEKLNVKIAENDYNIVVAKLNQGMVTPLDEQNSRIALDNAKISQQTAIYNYMRMSEDFQVRLAN